MMHFANGGATPDTVRHCPATEPEVPCCCAPDEPCGPCPPVAPDGGAGVVIGVCDSGLLADTGSAAWLGGVTGEVDPLGPLLLNGLYDIPRYCGHGTFIAGVARCEAPESTVYVANDFIGGGLQEWKVVQQLQALNSPTRPLRWSTCSPAATRATTGCRCPSACSTRAASRSSAPRATTRRSGSSGRPRSAGPSPSGPSARTSATWHGSATTATGWTSTRSARGSSTRSRPASTPTTSRRSAPRCRSSTAVRGGAAPRSPRRWSPALSPPRCPRPALRPQTRPRPCSPGPRRRRSPASAPSFIPADDPLNSRW